MHLYPKLERSPCTLPAQQNHKQRTGMYAKQVTQLLPALRHMQSLRLLNGEQPPDHFQYVGSGHGYVDHAAQQEAQEQLKGGAIPLALVIMTPRLHIRTLWTE